MRPQEKADAIFIAWRSKDNNQQGRKVGVVMATGGQLFSALAIFANRLPTDPRWLGLSTEQVQKGALRDPQRLADEFLLFIENGGIAVSGNLKVATAPFDLAEFPGKGWKILVEEQDKRSAALTKVDFADAEYLSCLLKDESSIKGEEKFSRLKAENRIRYGATVFMGLWLDYQARKKNSVLERLHIEKGLTFMAFFGDILEDPFGSRHALNFYRDNNGRWNRECYWFEGDWSVGLLSVVSP